MPSKIEHLKATIEPLRQQIINHKVYGAISTIDDLKIFMQHHVFAVWDFMSLLKALQNNLTCTSVPWYPMGLAETRYLINEIVTGEESDLDLTGNRKSHYELYLDAMNQCGADTTAIQNVVSEVRSKGNVEQAFAECVAPLAAANFMQFTFSIVNSKMPHLQSAVFTFGREDLIPGMFISMVNDMHKKFPNQISVFKYYLERHIEVDGNHHSHLALQMTNSLCANNPQYWKEAEQASIKALEMRIALWDAVYVAITEKAEKSDSTATSEKANQPGQQLIYKTPEKEHWLQM